MGFNKSESLFPSKREKTFLSHCGIAPMYGPSAEKAIELIRGQQMLGGAPLIANYEEQLNELRKQAAALMHTRTEDVAYVRNTSEALSMVANGYPFEPGDEVITFVQEYPANYYPWRLQERRGVKVKLLANYPARDDIDRRLSGFWSEEELLRLITSKTKVIAISHVQFTSGYAADLKRLGAICEAHGIDLVVDAAQSLGCMPVFPEECNIAALASAGWKWLLGPMGTGIFYSSAAMRAKLALVQVGAETMQQAFDFLNLEWNPQPTAKRFEYSTAPVFLVAALATSIREIHAHYGAASIFREIRRLQDVFLTKLDHPSFKPLLFDPPHRSGILSIYHDDTEQVIEKLAEKDIICSARGGLLRVAPHCYNTEAEVELLAETLNEM